MKIQIRPATKEDHQKLITLYTDFVGQPDRYKGLDHDSFLKVLGLPDCYIYVAEDESGIVGFISFSKRSVVRYPRSIVEVEEFYVIPELRRQGIGRRLMGVVLNFAQERGCQYVFLASSKDRIPAHHFYQALGFEEYAYHFRRKL